MKTTSNISQTIALGIGFLLGGFVGLACGWCFQSEMAVVIGYGLGAVVGSVAGVQIMRLRQNRS